MKLLILFLFCGSLTFSTINGLKYIDPIHDAVVIYDSSAVLDSALVEPESTTLPASANDECQTVSGYNGNCVPYDTCYPYGKFLLSEVDEEHERIRGDQLLDILNSTERCAPTGELPRGVQADSYVCCPNPLLNLPVRVNSTVDDEEVPAVKVACGTYASQPEEANRVVGGRPASKGEFPWIVALLNNGRQFCGGSLISQNYVLTAAHCVYGMKDASGVRINIGDHDVGSTGETKHESRSASKILYHRGFSMSTLRDDVALIKLSAPVSLSSSIQTVCLNQGTVPYGNKVDLAGWGKISNSGPASRTLMTVNMRLVPRTECQAEYQGTQAPPLTSGMVCAGEKSPLKDACNGDSGGPLTYAQGGQARQIGVVSWGIGCGQKYGVYTNVVSYLDWINKNSRG